MTPNFLRRLDLTTLQLFVSICEEGSLTRAATREAIAPSAVSKRLVELETTLGVQLLTRQAKGMATTPAGETLFHHARQMIFKAEQIALELSEHANGVRGYVRMLANLSAIVEFLPSDLRSFMARQQNIKIDLEEQPSIRIVKGVEDGRAEIGICAGTTDTHSLKSQVYRTDELVVVVPGHHPLRDTPAIALSETLDYDYVGLHVESSIYALVTTEARRSGRPLKLRVHAPGFDAVCRMVQAGVGIGVVPKIVVDLFGTPLGLVGIPMKDDWAKRRLVIVTRDQPLSAAAALLLNHLTEAGEAAV